MKTQVHRDDKPFIEVIKPNMKNGPWIAGGAVLQWINKMPVGLSDIDVFCKDEQQAREVLKRVSGFGYGSMHKTANAITMKDLSWNKKPYTQMVQIIHCVYFESPEQILDSFDFSMIQLVTDGTEVIHGPNTLKDIRSKSIRVTKFNGEHFLKRLTKYITYGYTPLEETLQYLGDTLVTDFTGSTEYDAAF
jgi:hypothetical protein